ncbi:hypothetical protein RhiXN_11913 [Rhizoctonia solani]|uniref:Uncharacterized protein n=1 Tax=Rhizoctonia solani TaxID=456999 RepID=A0A8H8PA55_9AGAM|nr:uncharacterized protein RhiXN_11913 [Rhizoctonia solani]QRW26252.1 hypothetical protein RhiXN_11913 [Rhizoctonia solani]
MAEEGLLYNFEIELKDNLTQNTTVTQDTQTQAPIPTVSTNTPCPESPPQNNLPESEHLATLTNSTPNGANISLPPETIQHNPRVTIEEWPNPNANWGLSNELMYDRLQIPPEDSHRAPDDIYACGHDVNDRSEAAQQFSKWSDQRLLEFLQEELGSKFVKEWENIRE